MQPVYNIVVEIHKHWTGGFFSKWFKDGVYQGETGVFHDQEGALNGLELNLDLVVLYDTLTVNHFEYPYILGDKVPSIQYKYRIWCKIHNVHTYTNENACPNCVEENTKEIIETISNQ